MVSFNYVEKLKLRGEVSGRIPNENIIHSIEYNGYILQ